MAITVTWDDGIESATSFTVPDEVLQSIEQLRALRNSVGLVQHATVKDMIVGVFIEQIVLPALAQFPTASIQAAQANVDAAQAALMAAKAAAIPGFGA